jgi:hypothetical protein
MSTIQELTAFLSRENASATARDVVIPQPRNGEVVAPVRTPDALRSTP